MYHNSPIIHNTSIKDTLEKATAYLRKSGIENPRLESELLLSFVLGIRRNCLYTQFKPSLNKKELIRFQSMLLSRSQREPLQYIIGQWGFWDADFFVSRDVFIPRKETEHLVEFALKKAAPQDRIVDLCTGTGNIVISMAKELPKASLWASDISRKAIITAQKNAIRHNVNKRINFLVGDLFSPFRINERGFDLILCNPPYIPTQDIERLQPEIKDYEPMIALDGGTDGLNFYKCLIPRSINYLNHKGYLIMEIGFTQSEVITDLLNDNGYFDIEVVKDYSGIDRVISGRYMQQ